VIAARRRPGARAPVELAVGPATRAWVVRLGALLAAVGTVAVLGRDGVGWVIGGLAIAALLLAQRSFGPAALVLAAATLLLRGPSPEPLVLAGAVLGLHLALALARVVEALPMLALVPLAVLRTRLPAFALAQAVGQVAAALAWAVRGTGGALPWLTVGALVATAVLARWVLHPGR
jgi:hypothetical protein